VCRAAKKGTCFSGGEGVFEKKKGKREKGGKRRKEREKEKKERKKERKKGRLRLKCVHINII